MDYPAERIIGTEMEWDILERSPGSRYRLSTLSNKQIESMLGKLGVTQYDCNSSDVFMANGSRVYCDQGLIESATAEDRSILGVIANENAGERLLLNSLKLAQAEGLIGDFVVSKRLINAKYESNGYHENYSTSIPLQPQTLKETLGPLLYHLATRNLFAGSGCVLPDHRNGNGHNSFFLGQKALTVAKAYNHITTRDKPLINLRDQPHTRSQYQKRLHVVSGDANMSIRATELKIGTTSIVLRLMESGKKIKGLEHRSGMASIAHQVAEDLTLQKTIESSDGRTIRPLDVQFELLAAAQKYDQNTGLPHEEHSVLQKWEEVLTDLEARRWSELAEYIDWVARYQILQAYMKRHNINIDDRGCMSLDVLWDEISEKGIGYKKRRKYLEENPALEDLIRRRMYHAPENTRAHVRGKLIRFCNENRIKINRCDWEVMTIAVGNLDDGESAPNWKIAFDDLYDSKSVSVAADGTEYITSEDSLMDELMDIIKPSAIAAS